MDNLLHTPHLIFFLLLIGFAAGFLDSIVGGGGLIATPAMMNLFPAWSMLSIIGTNRTSSIMGTSVAAWNYFQKVSIERRLVIPACIGALSASYLGANLAQKIPTDLLKSIVLVLIVILAFYTVFKKDLGQIENRQYSARKEPFVAFFIASACGFYNGLIGPGTGTMLVFGFVSVMGFDFLKSSAIAKVANVSGDISSWLVLLMGGFIVWQAAIPLVIGNMTGSFLGSKLAILKGSKFIRWVFLAVVLGLIARFVFLG
jgi:uncharacterized protein